MDTGIRDLKNNLSHYLREVKKGNSIIITEHNVPIAKIVSYTRPAIDDILVLQEAGLITWSGEKPQGLKNHPEINTDRSVSEMILEERR